MSFQRRVTLIAGLALATLALMITPVFADEDDDGDAGTHYKVTASNGRLIRLEIGDPVASIRGVPAEQVDSFVHDGDPDGIEALRGARFSLDIDPVANTGRIKASWRDRHGSWTYEQEAFAPPPHSTGLQAGPSGDETFLLPGGPGADPVTTNVYLHGDTTAGGPVLPTLFNLIATWGPAKVRLNGRPFNNPFDGPAPRWVGHSMTTVGARLPDGTVLTSDGDIFNPMEPGNGAVDNEDLEVHLVFHDADGPVTTNFPPIFSFFYHLQFEDVKMRVTHADGSEDGGDDDDDD